jgi:ketosteroid isomerase-like protein
MGIGVDTVKRIFSHLETGSGDPFFEHVADNVDWTVEGTHPLAGHYKSRQEFQAHTFARLNGILPGGTQLHIEHMLTDGIGLWRNCAHMLSPRMVCALTIAIAG